MEFRAFLGTNSITSVLKISAANSPVLPLGNSDAVQVGESVYAVGNPQGLEGTFSQGIVSSIREVGTDKLLQITAPISPGRRNPLFCIFNQWRHVGT